MCMRKVELRMKEKIKYETIKELVDHNGNEKRKYKSFINLYFPFCNYLYLIRVKINVYFNR